MGLLPFFHAETCGEKELGMYSHMHIAQYSTWFHVENVKKIPPPHILCRR